MVKKRKELSHQALYKGLKMSEIYLAQISKENVVRWIKIPPLDAKDTAPLKVINDILRIPKCQKQW